VGFRIVVAFRMSSAGMSPGPEGDYLSRARALWARAEGLGGELVAWSDVLLAIAWGEDSLEPAVRLAANIREESMSIARAWACGLSEGDIEAIASDGHRTRLSWGSALLAAASLARIAQAGEVMVDGSLRAVRARELSLSGERVVVDGVEGVDGWRLDLEHPWQRAPASHEGHGWQGAGPTAVGAGTVPKASANGSHVSEGTEDLTLRLRKIVLGDEHPATEALAELRRARMRTEGGPPSARCQAALALGMMLSLAGRPEEALLETLDALARAKEAGDRKATGACMALLAKLYAGVGLSRAATVLRETATGR
jgi:hypothetical protein